MTSSGMTQPPDPDKPAAPAHQRLKWGLGLAALAVCGLPAWLYWRPIWDYCLEWWRLLQDKDAFRVRIESYGVWAPAVFVIFQILQVFIAPIPGELVGAVGGYIFGWWLSVAYSTVGLTVGSLINFGVARLVGRAFVERVVPAPYMERLSFLMERQGVLGAFICFVVPGFPKDILCYILGLAPMSWRMFIIVCAIGRIPGTLMLSMQGALAYREDWWAMVWLFLASLAFVAPVYIWRERVYQFLYRLEKGRGPLQAPSEDKTTPSASR